MINTRLTQVQYLIPFSSNVDFDQAVKLTNSVISELTGESVPNGVDEMVFKDFFREVLHEEPDYICYRGDVICDSFIFDHNYISCDEDGSLEDIDGYVFGFVHESGTLIERDRIVRVFRDVITPLLKNNFPGAVVGSKIQTHKTYEKTVESLISI